jgi:pyruvate,orthophosphate dikinase
VCSLYSANSKDLAQQIKDEVLKGIEHIEKTMGGKFGDFQNPLLVSVRSGARVSMPGMMDTILNLGLNDKTVPALAKNTGNERFAYDCYRRFVQMYGDVVLGLKPENKEDADPFEEKLHLIKKRRGVHLDHEISATDLKELVAVYKALIQEKKGIAFPEDPHQQLWGAIGAVFASWHNERAIFYRKMNRISDEWGTAVNIQAMVFGNMGDDSGTGVGFTRNPATGEKKLFGEFLMNAQGEDVVAGIRTPESIEKLKSINPKAYDELADICQKLETHYGDMQDLEFTIQKGKLWMLQTRVGKRTGFASFRIAADMVDEGVIAKEEALMRVSPDQLTQLLSPVLNAEEKTAKIKAGALLTKGLNAGPGACSGRVAFFPDEAVLLAKTGDSVILVRIETSPEDIKGMEAAAGILTARGGMTSHAALVARQMGKVCVAGCGDLAIDYRHREMQVKGQTILAGDYITLDGFTGEVLLGKMEAHPSPVIQYLLSTIQSSAPAPAASEIVQSFQRFMEWSDQVRRLKIRTNADLPDQCRTAIAFGAEGIGLCRTEHMFFEGQRIDAVREMILAETLDARKKALNKILPMQKEDFKQIFKVMEDRPVTIRTLDPPLLEFLPHADADIESLAQKLGISFDKLKAKVGQLRETNPMLGHRGCRLGVSFPEITEMQVRAILSAACEIKKEGGLVTPEIMIPLISTVKEFKHQEAVVRATAAAVFQEYGISVEYLVGTMIEIPRAALTADEIAEAAEFFSFGTNDLTQMTFGISRDDAASFLPHYLESGILPSDPFQSVDQKGVGKLMKWAVEAGRQVRPGLKVGICGEHGGDPETIRFCHDIGQDYVSCSPFRIPVAKLAAAQAALYANKKQK